MSEPKSKPAFQLLDSKTNGKYYFDGDMHVNRDVWEHANLHLIADMIDDIQRRVKEENGLSSPEQVFQVGKVRITITDKQSREEREDKSIEKFTRRRNHAFVVKVEA